MALVREPLTREETTQVIERRGAARNIPLILHKWWGTGLVEKYGDDLMAIADRYPEDIVFTAYTYPGNEKSPIDNPSYRWGFLDNYDCEEAHSIGEHRVLLPDWDQLDDYLADFPDPNEACIFDCVKPLIAGAGERYVIGSVGNMAHERF